MRRRAASLGTASEQRGDRHEEQGAARTRGIPIRDAETGRAPALSMTRAGRVAAATHRARTPSQPARHTRRRQAQFIGSLRPWDGYPAAPSPPRLPPDGASTSLPVYQSRGCKGRDVRNLRCTEHQTNRENPPRCIEKPRGPANEAVGGTSATNQPTGTECNQRDAAAASPCKEVPSCERGRRS